MMRLVLFLLTACFLAPPPPPPARAADVKSAYDPDEFTISHWCGPPAEFTTLERYREVKEANFTLAFPPCAGMTVADNKKLLDYCEKVGIKAVIRDPRMVYAIGGSEKVKKDLDAMVADYKDHPALLGYHIIDEPGAHAFDGLAEVVAYLKEKDPAHPGYVNLLPTYAGPLGALGAATYEEYVRTYVRKVKPFVICYDNYHLFKSSPDRAQPFFENLDTVRKVSIETRTPFWNIVLLTEHGDYRHLSEPELRFEAMQTLAFGARGLLWFTYWFPHGVPPEEGWRHSMINADGSRDPHYDMAKAINADVKAIGDALARCDSVNVFQHGEGATIKPTSPSPITPAEGEKARLTIGVFKSRDGGKTLALVTNGDYKQPAKPSLLVQPPDATVERFDPATRTWSAAGRGTLLLDVNAGGGVLLRW